MSKCLTVNSNCFSHLLYFFFAGEGVFNRRRLTLFKRFKCTFGVSVIVKNVIYNRILFDSLNIRTLETIKLPRFG